MRAPPTLSEDGAPGLKPALLTVGICAAVIVLRAAVGGNLGFDYHGIWGAGHQILAGRSPYLAPDWQRLLQAGNSFIDPPLIGLLAAPFSLLPFNLALVLWEVLCAAGFALALSVVGVRDWRVYVLGTVAFPVLIGIFLGQPDCLLALPAALAWRYRGSRGGALAVGVLVAAKLLAWPLLLWLLATRRIRCSLTAAFSAAALLTVSWALIGFKGLLAYPRLLAADSRAFAGGSHSITALLMRLGISQGLSTGLAVTIAILIALGIVHRARGSDLGWFTAAITLGLLSSPILWSHYLPVLFVALAIARPRVDWVWLLAATVFVFSPIEPVAHAWQVVLFLLGTITIAFQCIPRSEGTTSPADRARR